VLASWVGTEIRKGEAVTKGAKRKKKRISVRERKRGKEKLIHIWPRASSCGEKGGVSVRRGNLRNERIKPSKGGFLRARCRRGVGGGGTLFLHQKKKNLPISGGKGARRAIKGKSKQEKGNISNHRLEGGILFRKRGFTKKQKLAFRRERGNWPHSRGGEKGKGCLRLSHRTEEKRSDREEKKRHCHKGPLFLPKGATKCKNGEKGEEKGRTQGQTVNKGQRCFLSSMGGEGGRKRRRRRRDTF